jgi:hypothetical protein
VEQEFDFDLLSKKQIEAMDLLSMNMDGGLHPRTLASLVKKGMIIQQDDHDGPWTIHRYFMPLPVHIRWCEWCSKQIEEE